MAISKGENKVLFSSSHKRVPHKVNLQASFYFYCGTETSVLPDFIGVGQKLSMCGGCLAFSIRFDSVTGVAMEDVIVSLLHVTLRTVRSMRIWQPLSSTSFSSVQASKAYNMEWVQLTP